jgi:hypothetical protein
MLENKEMSLILRSALARQDYWRDTLQQAKQSGDIHSALTAQRFVDEYDALISMTKSAVQK